MSSTMRTKMQKMKMQTMMRGKRAQNYEMVMVFAGIVLLITAFTCVLSVRNDIPTNPNLGAKTILLTEKTFDTLEFYFETSVTDVVNVVHLYSPEGLSDCNKYKGTNVADVLNDYYVVTPECLFPTLINTYEQRISSELDARLAKIDAREDGPSSINPKSYLFTADAKIFTPGQFMVSVKSNSDNDVLVNVISRLPLKLRASTPSKDGESKQWTFEASRNLMTLVDMSAQDKDFMHLTRNIGLLKEAALVKITDFYNSRDQTQEISVTEKSKLVTDISTALTSNVGLETFTPRSQSNINYYFSYVVLLNGDSIYIIFPNTNVAIFVHKF